MIDSEEKERRRNAWQVYVQNNQKFTLQSLYDLPSRMNDYIRSQYNSVKHALYDAIVRGKDLGRVEVTEFFPFIFWHASKIDHRCKRAELASSIEDMVQDGYVGMMRGINKLKQKDFGDDAKAAYLSACVHREMMKQLFTLLTPVSVCERNSLALLYIISAHISAEELPAYQDQLHLQHPQRMMKKVNACVVKRNIPDIIDEHNADPDETDALLEVVKDELGSLKENDRQILTKRLFEGKRDTEIAAEMGLSKTRVGQQMRRAQEYFSRALRRRYHEKRVPLDCLYM